MKVECQDLGKKFETRDRTIAVLEHLSLQVDEGEFVCLVGPSGCGKTTLLKIIAGLLKPSHGAVRFQGRSANRFPRPAMVFQEHGIFPWMTVIENVAFGLEMMGIPKRERSRRALEFIKKVGLGSYPDNYPHELSVGMRQRVAIARAFLVKAEILLMDEPFGSLDAQTRMVLQQELLNHWREDRRTILFVTHDIEEAVLLGDRVLVLTGSPSRVCEEISVPLERPRDPWAGNHSMAAEIKWHIWNLLEAQVRNSLSMTG